MIYYIRLFQGGYIPLKSTLQSTEKNHTPWPRGRAISLRDGPCSHTTMACPSTNLPWHIHQIHTMPYLLGQKPYHPLLGASVTAACLSPDTRSTELCASNLWDVSWRAPFSLGRALDLGIESWDATYHPIGFWLPWIPKYFIYSFLRLLTTF